MNKAVNAKKLAEQQAAERRAEEAEHLAAAVKAIVENYNNNDFDVNKQQIQPVIQSGLNDLKTTYSDEIIKHEYMSQLMQKIQDLDYDFGATSSPDQAKEKLVVMRYVDAILEVYQTMEPEDVYTDVDIYYTKYPTMSESHKKLFITAALFKYKLLITERTTAETAAAGKKTFFYDNADKLDDLEKYLSYAVMYADGDEQAKQSWRNVRALTYDFDQKKLVELCAAGDVAAMFQHYQYMVSKWGDSEDNIKLIDAIVMQAVIGKLGTLGITIGNESVPGDARLFPNILSVCATFFSIRTIRNIIPDNTYLDLAQKINALLQQQGVIETIQNNQWWLPFLCNIERKLGETHVGNDRGHILEQHNLNAVKTAIENAHHVIHGEIINEHFASPDNKLDSYAEYNILVRTLLPVDDGRYGVSYDEKTMFLLASMFDALNKNRNDIRYCNLFFTFLKNSDSKDSYLQKSGDHYLLACKLYVALSANINFKDMDYTNKIFYRELMSDLITNCQDPETKQALQENLLNIDNPRLTKQAVEEKMDLYLSGTLTLEKFKEETLRDTDKVYEIIKKRIEAVDPDALSLSELSKLDMMIRMVTVDDASFVNKQKAIQGRISGFINFTETNELLSPLFEMLKDAVSLSTVIDPVIVSPSGQTYSRAELAECMKQEYGNLDPKTKDKIESVAPNQAIANLLDEIYLQYQKIAAKEQEGTAIDLQKMLEVANAGVSETGTKDFMLQGCIEALGELIAAEKANKNRMT